MIDASLDFDALCTIILLFHIKPVFTTLAFILGRIHLAMPDIFLRILFTFLKRIHEITFLAFFALIEVYQLNTI